MSEKARLEKKAPAGNGEQEIDVLNPAQGFFELQVGIEGMSCHVQEGKIRQACTRRRIIFLK